MSNILIVDDNKDILDSLSFILEDEGNTVYTATEGIEVYRTINSFSPDIILLDVLLSGSDGREICKKLKENVKTKSIPIIMMSAHPTAREASHQIGADGFIEKPFEINRLLTMLKKYSSA